MRWQDLEEFAEGLVDEDEGDEDGEDLLGEAGDVAHQEAALHGHNDEHDDHQPHAHPDTAHDVFDALGLAELEWNKNEGTYDDDACSWVSAPQRWTLFFSRGCANYQRFPMARDLVKAFLCLTGI